MKKKTNDLIMNDERTKYIFSWLKENCKNENERKDIEAVRNCFPMFYKDMRKRGKDPYKELLTLL